MAVVGMDYKHVALDENRVPIIEGTNMKVIDVSWRKLPTAGVRKNCISSIPT